MTSWRRAVAVAAAYYVGAKLGLALTFPPNPVAVLWPPNAILLAALLLAPMRSWPLLVAAALPAHLLVQVGAGIPPLMIASWYVSNCAEALLGAWLIRRVEPDFDLGRLRSLLAFLAFGCLLAPFLTSFLDAGLVALNGWGDAGYLDVWERRFYSNVLAAVTLVPLIVSLARARPWAARPRPARVLEALALGSALVGLGVLAFASDLAKSHQAAVVLLYLPVPLLIWASLRFGLAGASTSFALVTVVVIWGAANGRGPFGVGSPAENRWAVQLYLVFLAPPLLALTAALVEREAAKQRLRSSEERFQRAFRSSPDAISISRARDGSLLDINHRWEELFGYRREDALGCSWLDLLQPSPADREDLEARPAVGSVARDLEIEAQNSRGERLRLVLSIEALELEGETCLLTTIRDATAQRRAEMESLQQRRQLTHLTRVNMLGELSGALAHELNQPLTAILTNAQAGQRFLAKTPFDLEQVREILQEIAVADQRAASVIHRLRALLRNDAGEIVRLDLNAVLDEALDFAHGELTTHHVAVARRLAPRLPPIEGDRIQLQQLFLNLVNNACEAMSGLGPADRVLTVSSARGTNGAIVASIADNGPGIAQERTQSVFDPFVTTKATGLGLGLTICRTIIKAHNGRIWFQNGSEGGAIFFTEFPTVRPAP